jgi:hypothetical protein
VSPDGATVKLVTSEEDWSVSVITRPGSGSATRIVYFRERPPAVTVNRCRVPGGQEALMVIVIGDQPVDELGRRTNGALLLDRELSHPTEPRPPWRATCRAEPAPGRVGPAVIAAKESA